MIKERLMKIILAPVFTEKSALVGDSNRQYIFKVTNDATKPEIKEAVEFLFDVTVNHVTVSNVKPKKKRMGQRMGVRKKWKKAYVSLAEGNDIKFANL